MPETLGTDSGNLTGQGGAVTNTAGDPLLGTDNDGEKSYALGPSLSRAITTGVINGDFGTPPPELSANIDNDENALPYFTTEVSHTDATAPYVQAVEDATAASGQVLRFTIPSGAAIGRYARIVRYVAVPGSAARTWTNQPRAAWRNATGTTKTQAIVTIRTQYYQNDGTTTTGTQGTNTATFATISAATYAYETQANPNVTGAIPTDGAYLKIEVGVQVSVLTTSEMTVDLTEVRYDRGLIQLLLADQAQPDNYGYGVVYLLNGTMWIRANETGSSGTNPTISLSASTGNISIDPTSTGTLIVSGDADIDGTLDVDGDITSLSTNTITGDKFRATSTTDASLSSTGHAFQIGDSSGQNLRIDSNEIMVVNNGGTTGMFLQSDGGTLQVGGNTTIVGTLTATNLVSDNDVTLSGTVINQRASATADVWLSSQTGDSVNRFLIEANGNLFWGSGSATRDTNLYRGAANLLETDDNLQVGSQLRVVAPTGTTQTSSQAIYFFVSANGSYELRRNTSSARYKTNIVDADEVVLEAARKVKPRHYESTIEAEAGATRLGFIAEEIHEAGLTHAVGYDNEGKPETIDPVALIAALWHRVSDLEDRLKALEAE
jgi:hypothetical protein